MNLPKLLALPNAFPACSRSPLPHKPLHTIENNCPLSLGGTCCAHPCSLEKQVFTDLSTVTKGFGAVLILRHSSPQETDLKSPSVGLYHRGRDTLYTFGIKWRGPQKASKQKPLKGHYLYRVFKTRVTCILPIFLSLVSTRNRPKVSECRSLPSWERHFVHIWNRVERAQKANEPTLHSKFVDICRISTTDLRSRIGYP